MEEGGISVCCLRYSTADVETVCPERKWRENGTLRDSSPRIARGRTSIKSCVAFHKCPMQHSGTWRKRQTIKLF